MVRPGMVLHGVVRVQWRRGRRRIHGPEAARELTKLLQMIDYRCGERSVATLRELVAALERHSELNVGEDV